MLGGSRKSEAGGWSGEVESMGGGGKLEVDDWEWIGGGRELEVEDWVSSIGGGGECPSRVLRVRRRSAGILQYSLGSFLCRTPQNLVPDRPTNRLTQDAKYLKY